MDTAKESWRAGRFPAIPKTFIRKLSMSAYSFVFLVLAIAAALFGFGGLTGAAAIIAKICFPLFLVIFIAAIVKGRRVPKNDL